MQYWIVAFIAALVVVIGTAAGPVGAVVSLVVFATALYLLWAYTLGFNGAWTRFGLDRLTAPLWKSENWEIFGTIFVDREKVIKAGTIALGLIALSLIVPVSQVGIALLAVAAWYVFEIYRTHKSGTRSTLETVSANDKLIYPTTVSRSESAKIN
jgi:hypothetical protein